MQGTIVTVDVTVGQQVRKGQQLMLIESMKMHHAIESSTDGSVLALAVAPGATVMEGAVVASVEPGVMMPELGRTLVDKQALALIREWIAAMPPVVE